MRIIKSWGFIFCTLLISISIMILSCSEGTNPNDQKFVLPDSNLSFYDDVQPLFVARCGTETGCHSPTDIDNPLLYNDLISRDGLVYYQLSSNGRQLVDLTVDPLNPGQSVLYLILYEGYPTEYYDQMPPPATRETLNANQLNGIKEWIREGAPE